MSRKTLLLYTTLGCHLCELAEEIALSVANPNDYCLLKVEISESDELMQAYGVRIPVLALEGAAGEIAWPFNAAQLAEFLAK